MCVFPHLCTLSRRKISSKFIWHCFLHLGVFQARRRLAWKEVAATWALGLSSGGEGLACPK